MTAGRLDPAVGPDGLLDFEAADRLLSGDLDPARGGDTGADTLGIAAARHRRLVAQAELAELELARRRGEMVPLAEVERGARAVSMAMVQSLEAHRLELVQTIRKAVDERQAMAEAERIEREVRGDLARRIDDVREGLSRGDSGEA